MRPARLAIFILLGVTTVLLPAVAAQSDDTTALRTRARKELDRVYRETDRPPAPAEVAALGAADPSLRRDAAAYLVVLLRQSLLDERSGQAPWKLTGEWHESERNPARELRRNVADALSRPGLRSDAVAVCRWFLQAEPQPDVQCSALEALTTMQDGAADRALLDQLAGPHPNSAVVESVLGCVAPRGLVVPHEDLARCCLHYRESIREPAREIARALGRPTPPAFDPVAAVQSAPICALIEAVETLLIESPGPDDPFVELTLYAPGHESDPEEVVRGWRVAEAGDSYVVLTPSGRRKIVAKAPVLGTWEEGRGPNLKTRLRVVPIAEEVERVVTLREDGDPESELAFGGGLTAQFDRSGTGIYEILLAQRLHREGRFALAARILLPALDALYTDDDYVALARRRLGTVVGFRMLAAFIGDRNYAEALRLAGLHRARYPETRFSAHADALAEQLPRRMDDFRTLTLPTRGEWMAMRITVPRAEQIDHLCRRLRLLNVFQGGQPGGIAITQDQYREPCGICEDAAWGRSHGKTEVINPYRELTGERTYGVGERRKGLGLEVADIPQLARHLREDWLILGTSFWRDFALDRNLHTTREILGGIIDSLACRPVSNVEAMAAMSGVETRVHLAKIADWARANAGKSRTELLLASLESACDEGRYWGGQQEIVDELIDLNEKRAAPIVLRFLARQGLEGFELTSLIGTCRLLDPTACVEAASRYADHEDRSVRIQVGRLMVAAGEKERGRTLLAKAFERTKRHDAPGMFVVAAAIDLLDEGSSESRSVVRALLRDRQRVFRMWAPRRHDLMRAATAADLPEAWTFYRRMLDIESTRWLGGRQNHPIADTFARELAERIVQHDPEVNAIRIRLGPDSAEGKKALKAWLDRKIDAATK